jgi:hypothetical protein
MNKLRTGLISLVTIIGLVATPLIPVAVYAQCSGGSGGGSSTGSSTGGSGSTNPVDSISGGVQCVGGKAASTTELTDNLKIIVNVLLFLLGSIAVIMIIIGGIRYTTSNGDASNTKAAKDTILYAVIGLVVAVMAYAIVNFVLGAFK